jgi:hypothetical protein
VVFLRLRPGVFWHDNLSVGVRESSSTLPGTWCLTVHVSGLQVRLSRLCWDSSSLWPTHDVLSSSPVMTLDVRWNTLSNGKTRLLSLRRRLHCRCGRSCTRLSWRSQRAACRSRASSRTRIPFILLYGLLVSLLQRLHLLLLLVATMDSFPNRSTNGTTHVLTPVVVTQYVSRAHAMRNKTLLIFAFCNMLP